MKLLAVFGANVPQSELETIRSHPQLSNLVCILPAHPENALVEEFHQLL
ncbi:MAG: hypothetical protein KAF91_21005 [Nostoc sp. TH1S01]|nr:hypothetical protein [Nostoc sp. TH1S01]